jgi:hypothetical protein
MKFRLFCTLSTFRALTCCASLLLLLMPALLAPGARAAEVEGLYEAGATVTSRDDERQRQQGFNAALREVLIKLTGRNDTLENSVITRALAAPQSFVETWAYNSIVPDDPFAQPAEAGQIQLQVTFFQAGIQQLLNDAGIAIWPPNRPETLVWLAVQDELGERTFASAAGAGSDLLTALQTEADERGVPLLMPLQDFSDLRALPMEQLWNFDLDALRIASSRYRNESILVMRVFRSLSGDVIGKAVYIFRDRVVELEALESPLEPFLEDSIELVAQELASYYAILLSGVDSGAGTEVLLLVDGVGKAADYAGLMQYLNGLPVVSNVEIVSVRGATIELALRTGGQVPQLIESIALDRRLRLLGEVANNGVQTQMHYQWSSQP